MIIKPTQNFIENTESSNNNFFWFSIIIYDYYCCLLIFFFKNLFDDRCFNCLCNFFMTTKAVYGYQRRTNYENEVILYYLFYSSKNRQMPSWMRMYKGESIQRTKWDFKANKYILNCVNSWFLYSWNIAKFFIGSFIFFKIFLFTKINKDIPLSVSCACLFAESILISFRLKMIFQFICGWVCVKIYQVNIESMKIYFHYY